MALSWPGRPFRGGGGGFLGWLSPAFRDNAWWRKKVMLKHGQDHFDSGTWDNVMTTKRYIETKKSIAVTGLIFLWFSAPPPTGEKHSCAT